MNYLTVLKGANSYKAMVAALKEVRGAGIDVKVRLNACKRAIEDEVGRLIKMLSIAPRVAPKVSKYGSIGKLYAAIALPMDAARAIARAVKGAIALAARLGL